MNLNQAIEPAAIHTAKSIEVELPDANADFYICVLVRPGVHDAVIGGLLHPMICAGHLPAIGMFDAAAKIGEQPLADVEYRLELRRYKMLEVVKFFDHPHPDQHTHQAITSHYYQKARQKHFLWLPLM